MTEPVRVQRLEPPTYSPARDLTSGEAVSLEKVAELRGFAGRMRRAIRDAMDQLRPEEPAYKILLAAMAELAP